MGSHLTPPYSIAPRSAIRTCPVDWPCNTEERIKGTELIVPTGVIDNPDQLPAAQVTAQYEAWVERFARHLSTPAGAAIRAWGEHFLKITRSYWAGLFHTYDVAGLPRTDNDLEHLFGQVRHQERRISGRKVVSASLIVRGAVRVLAAILTWLQPPTPSQLGEVDPVLWREERRRLGKLRQAQVLQSEIKQSS